MKAYGLIFSAICLFFVLFNRCDAVFAATDDPYVQQLIQKAEHEKIYDERPWRILLHYKGTRSLITDPRFFISTDGRKNPAAELKATISSMFSAAASDNEQTQCRFPLRSAWLKGRLGINPDRLPRVSCTEFEEIRKRVNPKKAVLAFPAAYMNKPASLFGHTFIRIDNQYQSKLLGHALNYAAYTGNAGGFLYAIKGIFGFFKGYYSVLPYYEKVKEYNDMEQRDIWEYELNLTDAELEKMVMHLWELKDSYSPYYFFDENCSSNILFLFEAARPTLHLTDQLGWWVIPIDTVRLAKKEGLISRVIYRPSRATVINHISSKITPELRQQAKDISDGKVSPDAVSDPAIALPEKRAVLDLSAELTQYSYSKKEISKEDYQKRFLGVLNARSKLGQENESADEIARPTPPDEGHGSYRLGIYGGFKKGLGFTEIAFRPAYHTLIDADEGYQKGSQIVFGDIAARYYPAKERFRIESFDLINIISISPRNVFYSPISWKVSTGLKREYLRDGYDHAMFYGNIGTGLSGNSDLLGLAYVFAEAEVNSAPSLRDAYALGAGGSIGAIRTITDFWKVHLYGRAVTYQLGDRHDVYKGSIEQNFRITRNISIIANISRLRESRVYATELKAGLNIFF